MRKSIAEVLIFQAGWYIRKNRNKNHKTLILPKYSNNNIHTISTHGIWHMFSDVVITITL